MLLIASLIVLTIFCVWNYLIRREPLVGERHKKCVFITGCDSGFGNGLALRLDARGVPVFAGCLTEAGARDLKQKTSERLQTVLVDVAKADSVTHAYNFVKERLKPGQVLWGIVNNAGMGGLQGPFEFMTTGDYRDIFEVNVIGLVDVTRKFLPLLKGCGGRIINTASGVAVVPFPGMYPYCASKHAVRSISATLRIEMQQHGVGVTCVLPGWFGTPIADLDRVERLLQERFDGLPKEITQGYESDAVHQIMQLKKEAFNKFVNTDVTPVIDAYENGLFAQTPRAEYYPGIEVLAFLMTNLPQRLAAYVFCNFLVERKMFRMPGFIKKQNIG